MRVACIIASMRNWIPVLFALAVSACGSGSSVDDHVVARIGDVAITARELQARAPALAQSFRAQLAAHDSDADKRLFLLNLLLKDEAVAQEARRLGYHWDPALRGEMIDRVLQEEVEASEKPVELPDADIERYYIDHLNEIQRPPAFTPTLAQAAPAIRAKLRHLLVERKKGALARWLLQRAKVEIDYVALVKVPLPKF
jgi:hypothetical protein